MNICKLGLCTGCGACVDACPEKCITFNLDKDGFYQSYVDSNQCIKCQKCVKVCPGNNPNKSNAIT